MGFYGNVSNITRSTFQFDQIYSNRLTMDAQTNEDGIYIGRYVLVEYDKANDFDVFTRIYPVNTKIGSGATAREEVYFYTAPQATTPQALELVKGRAGKYYYSADEDATASYTGLTNLVFYKCEKDNVYILGEVDEAEPAKGFTKIAELDTTDAGDYTVNYNLDLNKYHNSRGYDSTVWMKTYAGDEIKYVMIAELNTVVPTFDVSVDPPSEIPNQPHFGKDSTNVYYDLHVQPSWGFRVKEAKDENGVATPSDVKIDQNYTYYNLEGNQELGKGIIPVNGDIYFNADGFKINKSTHDNIIKDTIKLSKGSSGARVYNKHDGSMDLTSAEDIQELSIHLPSIGNAVADLYDVLYSDERNTMMDWRYHGYENGGLRLSQFFAEKNEDTGDVIKEGYKYNPDYMGTMVASINTLHDFVGMIIDDKSYKSSNYIGEDTEALAQRKQQFINTSDDATIYYDIDTNKYFRKTIGYDYLDAVKYNYSLVEDIDVDNYQSNIYYIKEGTEYVPDINGEYQADKDYYARSAVSDEYYDKVKLTNYTADKYYSLINGVYTKSFGENFDEALNYYDVSQRKAKTFDGAYIESQYYLKDTTNGVKYTLYKEKYDIDGENKDVIHNQLSAITAQDTKNVIFYRQGYWFYKDVDGYYLDEKLTENRTYYIITDAQKTTIRDAYNKPVDIYIPLVGTPKIEIDPTKYRILDYDKPEEWKDKIFIIENGQDYKLTSAIETRKVPDSDKEDETLFHFVYGEKNDFGEIKYIEFKDNLTLYTPNTYYSEDIIKPTDFTLDSGTLDLEKKNYYEFDPETQAVPVHDNNTNYFYTSYDESQGASKVGYYFEKDLKGNYNILTGVLPASGDFYKLSNNDLYVIEDTNHIYDKYTVWNSNATIIPPTLTLKRRKEKYVFEELKEFGIQYNTLLGILLEARRVLSTSLDIPEETRDTSTVQGCINKLNDIFAYFDNRYPGQFLITDAYDRIVNAPITTAQSDTITNIGTTATTTIATPMENRWIEVNINSDPVNPQIKYQHNFNPLPEEDNTTTNANKNKQLEVDGKAEDARGNGLNKTTGDTLSLYTPIVDGMGHVVGKNTETVILPYGYKTFTTNGVVSIDDKDLYSTINLNENGANTTTVSDPEQTLSMADNTQDTIAVEPFNKWIQTKILEDVDKGDIISVAHAIHSVDTTKKAETDINDNGDTITLQDMVFDKAGHIIENHAHAYKLPNGFKKIEVINTASDAPEANATKELAIKNERDPIIVAGNSQDTFHIITGNRWIRMSAADGPDNENQIVIQHEKHETTTTTATAIINLASENPQSFETKEYNFDDAGHYIGTITTTVSIPNNYGIFTDGANTTTAGGAQDTITINGDAHILPTIGKDTLTISHQVAQTATQCSTAFGNVVNFGDSFTIPNVYYDDNGHIKETTTFTITIPELATPDTTATVNTTADVIKTISINATTGAISATRANVNDLVLTGFAKTATTTLTTVIISAEDKIGTAFNKVESRLNGAENKLDTIQGNGDGSIKKAIADASTTLNNSITEVNGRIDTINGAVNTINGNEVTEGSIAYAISTLRASIETDYVKKTDYDTKIDALQKEIDALKALVEQYHPTSTDPGEETGG